MTGHIMVINFYPRHPRGWRQKSQTKKLPSANFYPRHPRGWRHHAQKDRTGRISDFYPRHPRGWRPGIVSPCFSEVHRISIHATLAGGDQRCNTRHLHTEPFLSTPPSRVATATTATSPNTKAFLSTPPSRVATSFSVRSQRYCNISIHATLAGGDGKDLMAKEE